MLINDFESIYGFPLEYFKDHVLDSGGDFNIASLTLENLPYEEFKCKYLKLLQKEFTNPEDDTERFSIKGKLFSEIEEFDLTEEDYNKLLEDTSETIRNLSILFKREKGLDNGGVEAQHRFPIETILNGVFTQDQVVDKTILTEEEKVYFNVHGLPDDMYDLFIDVNNDRIIPIYYDKSTFNEQWYVFTIFLEKLYSNIGIKGNPLTPLMLFDRDLMGLDTMSVTDPEIMRKVALEGRRNPYYHFREIIRLTPDANGVSKPYFLNIATWTFLWLYAQNINTFREQSRQTGKTFDMGHTGSMEFSYASERCSIGIFHYVYNKAAENRRTWVGYANLYPKYLQLHNIITKVIKGKSYEQVAPEPMLPSTTKVVENKKTKVKFIAIAIGTSKMAAEQAGRGATLRIIFGDELNFIKYIKIAFTALMFAHGTARKMAMLNGQRTGMHFASTAGTLDTEQGRMMHKFIFEDMVKFDPVLFQLNHEELKSFIASKSKNRFVLISYSYKDLGFSEEWLDESIAGKSAEEVKTDMFNMWLSTTSGGLFNTDALARIDGLVRNTPQKTFLFNKLNIFRFNGKYESFEDLIHKVNILCIGMDFANGDLADYTSFTGIDLITGERLFDFDDNQIDNVDCAVLIKSFVKYILSIRPNIRLILNPEVDGPGKASIIPNLKKDPIIEKYLFRAYYETNKELKDTVVKSTSYSINSKTMVEYGTSMKRYRDVLFNSLLFELVDKYPYAFNDQKTSDEVKTLVRNRTGKILAKSGFHDDKIASTLHAYSVLFIDRYVECLEMFFNIHVSSADLEAEPLTSTVYNLRDETGVAGSIEWKIKHHRDEYGQDYDTIEVFKIINGSKILLNPDQIREEAEHNKELKDTLNGLKVRRIITTRVSANKINYTKENNLINGYNRNTINELRMSGRNRDKKRSLLY